MNANNNYKTTLCFKFISTGSCSYHERCEYLHDNRCSTIYINNIRKIFKNNNNNNYNDISFFWPKITSGNNEEYNPFFEYGNKCIAEQSIWYNYLLNLNLLNNNKYDYHNKNISNIYTNKKRLNCFITLSQGLHI